MEIRAFLDLHLFTYGRLQDCDVINMRHVNKVGVVSVVVILAYLSHISVVTVGQICPKATMYTPSFSRLILFGLCLRKGEAALLIDY